MDSSIVTCSEIWFTGLNVRLENIVTDMVPIRELWNKCSKIKELS